MSLRVCILAGEGRWLRCFPLILILYLFPFYIFFFFFFLCFYALDYEKLHIGVSFEISFFVLLFCCEYWLDGN